MCGICGYYGIYQPGLINRMMSLIAHRGPDDSHFFEEPSKQFAMGHTRLSIIDLSPEGRQPLENEKGSIFLVCNGEIYNYKTLRAELIEKGHIFNSHSDSEVLIHLYEEKGHDMLSSLNGIFSFALYDSEKSELFCARDHLGVKPFYYSNVRGLFSFASELKSILAIPQIPKEIDPDAIQNHLIFLWSPSPVTMFKYIRKLEPGFALLIKKGEIKRHWRFYDIPYRGRVDIVSENEGVKLVQKYLKQAVERQMIADVEVGAFLSGGLDSSSVVSMMKQLHPGNRTKCYTISYREGEKFEGFVNDLPYARTVAKYLDVDLEEVVIDANIVNNIKDMIYHLDEPQSDLAPLYIKLICQRAREQGVKVLLSGAGGDDIFSGYRRHAALYLENYWAWLPYIFRNLIMKGTHLIPVKLPLMRRVRKLFENASLDERRRLISYFFWLKPEKIKMLYSDDLSNNLGDYDASDPMYDHLKNIPEEKSPLNQMLYLEGKTFLPDHNLNYTDKMGMAYGVEVRVPLLDIDLVDLCTRISPQLKQNKLSGKYIFKKAMEPFLPHEIIYRPKGAIPSPLRNWLVGDLKELVRDYLSEERVKKRKWFNYKAVDKLIRDNENMKVDASYTIWALVSMEIWADLFLDHSFC